MIENLFPNLNRNQTLTIVSLMRNGRLTDSKLKDILGYKSENSAAYYRKELEKKGIIKGYTAEIDWEKLGYSTRFLIIVEAENSVTLHEIERDHIFAADEYLKNVGDIVSTPTLFGNVLLKDVATSYGTLATIHGLATSEDAVRSYSEIYLKERYHGIQTTVYILKDFSIIDFFIQKEFIEKYKKLSPMTEKDEKRLEMFRGKFFKRFAPRD
ncbi:MAG TPA: hypothetical protein ENH13_07455 [Euryarchaeota archaeon]|nr:hypothetical protein BMS3Abin16_01872 [archaeon BMS3Abin16]GBE55980.1 hypothetical protein BMS3Bbin16_00177 [archaeon BMS3Bbin16]HDH28954.1 hypothetical protein [Euryarchaeota archaeon]HDY73924.1 hypothetical protein [Euryarchaeota archaeon]